MLRGTMGGPRLPVFTSLCVCGGGGVGVIVCAHVYGVNRLLITREQWVLGWRLL